jgi:hypothetical protein
MGGILVPALNSDGSIEKYQNKPLPIVSVQESPVPETIAIPVVDDIVSVN